MMNTMYFKITPQKHPYEDEESSTYEAWGKLEIVLNTTPIITHEWDMIPVIEWMMENKEYLLADLPFTEISEIPLAEVINQLYSTVDILDTPQEYWDKVETYLEHHTFKLRGTDVPILYIGLINANVAQLSYRNGEQYHCYDFDMSQFIQQTLQSITIFFEEWQRNYYHENAYKRMVATMAAM